MKATAVIILASLLFLGASFLFGTLEGFAHGYWTAHDLEGRYIVRFLDEWWFYAGRKLLPASIIALLLYRFVYPSVRERLQTPATGWVHYLALVACFVLSTIPAMIWGYIQSMPVAFLISVGFAAGGLRLEPRLKRAAA